MAKWLGEGSPPYTGTIDDITIYHLDDKWYVRARSTVTTKRILKDPVFEGFRKSAVRMKDASPIASKVYRQLSVKQYALFREMTGKALLLLKAGFTATEVERELLKAYLPSAKCAVNKTETWLRAGLDREQLWMKPAVFRPLYPLYESESYIYLRQAGPGYPVVFHQTG